MSPIEFGGQVIPTDEELELQSSVAPHHYSFGGVDLVSSAPFKQTLPDSWVGPELAAPIESLEGGLDYMNLVQRNATSRMGFLESITEWGKEDIPFVGDWYSAKGMLDILDTAKKVRDGHQVTSQELLNFNKYLEAEKRVGGSTSLGLAGEITKGFGKFWAEIATMTATLFIPTPAEEAAGIGTRVSGEIAEQGAKKLVKKGIASTIRSLGTRAARETGETAATAATKILTSGVLKGKMLPSTVNTYSRIAKASADIGIRGLIMTGMSSAFGTPQRAVAEQRLQRALSGGDPDAAMAVLMGVVDTWIEFSSEQAGEHFGKAMHGVISKVGNKEMADIVVGGGLIRHLSNKGTIKNYNQFLDWLELAGHHGVVNEFMEERLGGFLRGLTGVNGNAGISEAVRQAIPTWRQAGAELMAFAIPGIAASSISYARNAEWIGGTGLQKKVDNRNAVLNGLRTMQEEPGVLPEEISDGPLLKRVIEEARTQRQSPESMNWIDRAHRFIQGPVKSGSVQSYLLQQGYHDLVSRHNAMRTTLSAPVEGQRALSEKEIEASASRHTLRHIAKIRKAHVSGLRTKEDVQQFNKWVKDGNVVAVPNESYPDFVEYHFKNNVPVGSKTALQMVTSGAVNTILDVGNIHAKNFSNLMPLDELIDQNWEDIGREKQVELVGVLQPDLVNHNMYDDPRIEDVVKKKYQHLQQMMRAFRAESRAPITVGAIARWERQPEGHVVVKNIDADGAHIRNEDGSIDAVVPVDELERGERTGNYFLVNRMLISGKPEDFTGGLSVYKPLAGEKPYNDKGEYLRRANAFTDGENVYLASNTSSAGIVEDIAEQRWREFNLLSGAPEMDVGEPVRNLINSVVQAAEQDLQDMRSRPKAEKTAQELLNEDQVSDFIDLIRDPSNTSERFEFGSKYLTFNTLGYREAGPTGRTSTLYDMISRYKLDEADPVSQAFNAYMNEVIGPSMMTGMRIAPDLATATEILTQEPEEADLDADLDEDVVSDEITGTSEEDAEKRTETASEDVEGSTGTLVQDRAVQDEIQQKRPDKRDSEGIIQDLREPTDPDVLDSEGYTASLTPVQAVEGVTDPRDMQESDGNNPGSHQSEMGRVRFWMDRTREASLALDAELGKAGVGNWIFYRMSHEMPLSSQEIEAVNKVFNDVLKGDKALGKSIRKIWSNLHRAENRFYLFDDNGTVIDSRVSNPFLEDHIPWRPAEGRKKSDFLTTGLNFINAADKNAPGLVGMSHGLSTILDSGKRWLVVDGAKRGQLNRSGFPRIVSGGGTTVDDMSYDDIQRIFEFEFNRGKGTYMTPVGKFGERNIVYLVEEKKLSGDQASKQYAKFLRSRKASEKGFQLPQDEFDKLSTFEKNLALYRAKWGADIFGRYDVFQNINDMNKRMSQIFTPGIQSKPKFDYIVFKDPTKQFDGMMFYSSADLGEQMLQELGPLVVSPENHLIKNFGVFKHNDALVSWKPMMVDVDELTSYPYYRHIRDMMKKHGVSAAIADTSLKVNAAGQIEASDIFSVDDAGDLSPIEDAEATKYQFDGDSGAAMYVTTDFNYSTVPELKKPMKQPDTIRLMLPAEYLKTYAKLERRAIDLASKGMSADLLTNVIPLNEPIDANRYGGIQIDMANDVPIEWILAGLDDEQAKRLLSIEIQKEMSVQMPRTVQTSIGIGGPESSFQPLQFRAAGRFTPASLDSNASDVAYEQTGFASKSEAQAATSRESHPWMYEIDVETGLPSDIFLDRKLKRVEAEDGSISYSIPGEPAFVIRVPGSGPSFITPSSFRNTISSEGSSSVAMGTKEEDQIKGEDYDGDQKHIITLMKSSEGNYNFNQNTYAGVVNRMLMVWYAGMTESVDSAANVAMKESPIEDDFFDRYLGPERKAVPWFTEAGQRNTYKVMHEGKIALGIGASQAHALRIIDHLKIGLEAPIEIPAFQNEKGETVEDLAISRLGIKEADREEILQRDHVWNNQMINFLVDDSKNPKAERLGINRHSAPVFYAFAAGGFGEDVDSYLSKVFDYLRSPIVRDFVSVKERLAKPYVTVENQRSELRNALAARGHSKASIDALAKIVRLQDALRSISRAFSIKHSAPRTFSEWNLSERAFERNENVMDKGHDRSPVLHGSKRIMKSLGQHVFENDIGSSKTYDSIRRRIRSIQEDIPAARRLSPQNTYDLINYARKVEAVSKGIDLDPNRVVASVREAIAENPDNRFLQSIAVYNSRFGQDFVGVDVPVRFNPPAGEELAEIQNAFDALPEDLQDTLVAYGVSQYGRLSAGVSNTYMPYIGPIARREMQWAMFQEQNLWNDSNTVPYADSIAAYVASAPGATTPYFPGMSLELERPERAPEPEAPAVDEPATVTASLSLSKIASNEAFNRYRQDAFRRGRRIRELKQRFRDLDSLEDLNSALNWIAVQRDLSQKAKDQLRQWARDKFRPQADRDEQVGPAIGPPDSVGQYQTDFGFSLQLTQRTSAEASYAIYAGQESLHDIFLEQSRSIRTQMLHDEARVNELLRLVRHERGLLPYAIPRGDSWGIYDPSDGSYESIGSRRKAEREAFKRAGNVRKPTKKERLAAEEALMALTFRVEDNNNIIIGSTTEATTIGNALQRIEEERTDQGLGDNDVSRTEAGLMRSFGIEVSPESRARLRERLEDISPDERIRFETPSFYSKTVDKIEAEWNADHPDIRFGAWQGETPEKGTLLEKVVDMFEAARLNENEYVSSIMDPGAEWIPRRHRYVRHFYRNLSRAEKERIKRLKNQFRFREDSGTSKKRRFETYEDAFDIYGVVPASARVDKLYMMRSRDVWRAATNKMMLSQAVLSRDANGQPLVLPVAEPRSITDPNISSAISNDIYGKALAQYVDWLNSEHMRLGNTKGVTYDKNADPRTTLNKLLLEGDFDPLKNGYTEIKLDEDVYPSFMRFYTKKGTPAKVMRNITEVQLDGNLINAVQTFNSMAKEAALAFSLFHPAALMESLVAMYGLRLDNPAIPWNWASTFFALSNIMRRAKADPSFFAEFTQAGLVADFRNPDVQVGFTGNMLESIRVKELPALSWGAEKLNKYREWNSTILWSVIHPAIKLGIAERIFEEVQTDPAKYGYRPEQRKKMMQDISQLVNDGFGGQEFERHLWASPRVKQALHLAFFAPDWTLSAIKIAGTLPGLSVIFNPNASAFQKQWGTNRYWPAMGAIVMFAIPNAIQAAIYSFAVAAGADDPDDRPFVWQNEVDKRSGPFGIPGLGHIDVTPLVRMLPGGKGNDRRVYIRFAKQATEIFEGWFERPADQALSKTSIAVKTAWEQITGQNTIGWDLDFQNEGFSGILKGSKNGFWGSRVAYVGKKFLPMSVLSMIEGRPTTFFAPSSRGMSRYTAQTRMAEILEAYAREDHWSDISKSPQKLENLEQLFPDLMDAVSRNGYDEWEVFVAAKKRALGSLYSDFYKALNEGKDAELEDLARGIIRVHGSIQGMQRSMKRRYQSRNQEFPPEALTRALNAFDSQSPSVGQG